LLNESFARPNASKDVPHNSNDFDEGHSTISYLYISSFPNTGVREWSHSALTRPSSARPLIALVQSRSRPLARNARAMFCLKSPIMAFHQASRLVQALRGEQRERGQSSLCGRECQHLLELLLGPVPEAQRRVNG
jgi:hypothetical protein